MQLLVLGMHRSGTSTAARILNLLGCHFAPESLAVGANDENPKGFWERLDVVDLNDSMLRAAGAVWHSPCGFDPLALPDVEIARFMSTAGAILRDLDMHRPWFIKDPRLCLTLPLWRRLLAAPLAVHVLRHPLEVAASLQARNALPIPVGLALWEIYVRLSLTESAAWPRVVVHHRDLLADTVPTVLRLLQTLQAAGVTGLTMPAEQVITDFVTPSLHRQRANREDLLPWADAPQVQLFHRLEADITSLDGEPCTFTREAVRAIAAHEVARGAAIAAERAAAVDEVGHLRQEHAFVVDALRQLREERAMLVQLADLSRDRERQIGELSRKTADLEDRLATADREADGLRRDLTARTVSLAAKAADAKAAEARLQHVRHSPAWRVARELRRLWEQWEKVLGKPGPATEHDRERVIRSGLFDRDWYLATYADIAAVEIDPLDHYLRWGGFEGRNPGPAFDSAAYLLAHPEIAEAGINPLVHHLLHVGKQDAAATDRQAA